jgi:hypothetical protein
MRVDRSGEPVTGNTARDEVVAVAMKYLDANEDELILLVDRAWRFAGIHAVPTRGVTEYWRLVCEDIIKDIRTQGEMLVVTVGITSDRVMEWGAMHGVSAIEPYAVPLGVLTALATRRLLNGPRRHGRERDGGRQDG